LLAHCGGGQDKPGFLGPSAETPALFLAISRLGHLQPQRHLCLKFRRYEQGIRVAASVTSSQPCTSEQEISTSLLVEDEGVQVASPNCVDS
jgi:hypothetical protein